MGTNLELNDTLQLTTAQGFPADVFDLDRHQRKPLTLADVRGKRFTFRDKASARVFHLDPVRVYFVHNIDGKWLFWGHALIQSLEIQKSLSADGSWDGHSWSTSGAYVVSKIYEPEHQRLVTNSESPQGRSYFQT